MAVTWPGEDPKCLMCGRYNPPDVLKEMFTVRFTRNSHKDYDLNLTSHRSQLIRFMKICPGSNKAVQQKKLTSLSEAECPSCLGIVPVAGKGTTYKHPPSPAFRTKIMKALNLKPAPVK
jgi:hypothetical protein